MVRSQLVAGALALLGAAVVAAQPAETPAWVVEARGVATSVPPQLLSVLQQEIAKGGPEGAIAVCRDQAPALARAASERSGWNVRRVSLRNRNPKAVPDAWERAALEDFDRRRAAGEAPATLERAEIVVEGDRSFLRYMRALPTIELCTQCHGAPERLSPAVKAQLAQLYPDDRATGYAVGEIRGAMTLKKPAP
jgi:hypothetical protein